MSLSFPPRIGSVLVCDFGGFVEPEMVKRREVVVVGRSRPDQRLVTVVPLSTTAPRREEAYHHRLARNPRPNDDPEKTVWAKCDMIYTLSTRRMDLHYTRTRRGGRQHALVKVCDEDLEQVRRCVAASLGLSYTLSIPSRNLSLDPPPPSGESVEPAGVAGR